MKSIFATLIAVSSLLACTSNATAIPADQASVQTSADGMTIVELEVTDDRFPGITFKGTAKSIHEQIQAINPGASSDVNVENVVEKLGIEKPSTFNCDWGTDVTGATSCHDGWFWLRKLNDRKCCVNGGFEHCAMISCSYTCGLFLCNKRDTMFCAACWDLARDMKAILNTCKPHIKYVQLASGAMDFDDHFTGVQYHKC